MTVTIETAHLNLSSVSSLVAVTEGWLANVSGTAAQTAVLVSEKVNVHLSVASADMYNSTELDSAFREVERIAEATICVGSLASCTVTFVLDDRRRARSRRLGETVDGTLTISRVYPSSSIGSNEAPPAADALPGLLVAGILDADVPSVASAEVLGADLVALELELLLQLLSGGLGSSGQGADALLDSGDAISSLTDTIQSQLDLPGGAVVVVAEAQDAPSSPSLPPAPPSLVPASPPLTVPLQPPLPSLPPAEPAPPVHLSPAPPTEPSPPPQPKPPLDWTQDPHPPNSPPQPLSTPTLPPLSSPSASPSPPLPPLLPLPPLPPSFAPPPSILMPPSPPSSPLPSPPPLPPPSPPSSPPLAPPAPAPPWPPLAPRPPLWPSPPSAPPVAPPAMPPEPPPGLPSLLNDNIGDDVSINGGVGGLDKWLILLLTVGCALLCSLLIAVGFRLRESRRRPRGNRRTADSPMPMNIRGMSWTENWPRSMMHEQSKPSARTESVGSQAALSRARDFLSRREERSATSVVAIVDGQRASGTEGESSVAEEVVTVVEVTPERLPLPLVVPKAPTKPPQTPSPRSAAHLWLSKQEERMRTPSARDAAQLWLSQQEEHLREQADSADAAAEYSPVPPASQPLAPPAPRPLSRLRTPEEAPKPLVKEKRAMSIHRI